MLELSPEDGTASSERHYFLGSAKGVRDHTEELTLPLVSSGQPSLLLEPSPQLDQFLRSSKQELADLRFIENHGRVPQVKVLIRDPYGAAIVGENKDML
eukprot:3416375-Prymnesium_polylepis.1